MVYWNQHFAFGGFSFRGGGVDFRRFQGEEKVEDLSYQHKKTENLIK